MRFGYIGAAAAALCAAVPAQAAVVVVQIDAYAKGTIQKIEENCGGVCSTFDKAGYFTLVTTVDLAEGASSAFQIGAGFQSGLSSGIITRSGYDIYGAVYYVGSNFVYDQTTLIVRDSRITGAITTALRADSFTVRQVQPAPVPEPATWAMMIVGFAAAGRSLRRRKAATLAFS